jgi:ankyrin repeat protein
MDTEQEAKLKGTNTNIKRFWLIVLALLVVATTLTSCKRKEAARSRKPGWNALHQAASNRRRTADVEELLANGAHVDSRDKAGRTPLHCAAFLGHIKTVEVLLAYAADVNAKDNKGETPLHHAAGGGMPDIAELLLDAGADINARTGEGKTALDYVNRKIDLLKQMTHTRPVADKGLGKKVVNLALEQAPSLLQRYKACAEVLREHSTKQ